MTVLPLPAAWDIRVLHDQGGTYAMAGRGGPATRPPVGTTAAYAWSLWALVFGGAGTLDYGHAFEFRIERAHGMPAIYLEAVVAMRTGVASSSLDHHHNRTRPFATSDGSGHRSWAIPARLADPPRQRYEDSWW